MHKAKLQNASLCSSCLGCVPSVPLNSYRLCRGRLSSDKYIYKAQVSSIQMLLNLESIKHIRCKRFDIIEIGK